MARLPTLDGLRGLAAIAVMLFHWSVISGWSPRMATGGYLAVDLFFALSGFVIAGAYADRLKDGLPASRFVMLRLARLGPMHVLGQVVGFAVMVGCGLIALGPALLALPLGLAMLPVPVEAGEIAPVFPLNGPAWSLSWEIAANILFALALPFLTLRRLGGAIIVSAILLAVTAITFGSLHVGWDTPHIIGGAPRVMFSFCAGIAIWHVRPQARTSTAGALVLCAIATGALLFGTQSWIYDLPVVLILFPAILYFAAAWQPSGTAAGVCRSLGDLSYPLYVLHLPVIYLTASALRSFPHDPALDRLVWTLVLLALVIGSWWIARLVDLPAQAFLRERLRVRQTA